MPVEKIACFVVVFLRLYYWLLLARIILSWFPISWYNQPWKTLDDITEPVMAPFRRIIPAIGGIDISPILLFFVLQFIVNFLGSYCPANVGF